MPMTLSVILYWITAYLIGSIPFGWLIVWFLKRKDIRYYGSGRMGMSNVLRVTNTFWGIVTAVLDVLKGFAGVHAAHLFFTDVEPWMTTFGALLTVVGHIYSIFLLERRRDGKLWFRGGAGGLTSGGAAAALWPGVLWFFPLPCLLIYLFTGYASMAVGMFNIFNLIGYIVGASLGKCSWWYTLYAVGAEILVLLTLRPNIKRLKQGRERKSSLRIRWRKEDRENKK